MRNMETGLKRIADKARSDESTSFTSLLHHLTPELVWKHLKKMKINTAVGVDKESLEEAKNCFDKWVDAEIQAIHRKGYKAPPVRRVYIPKEGSAKKRPLGIPTVKDRAIQGAIAEILNNIYEQDFLKQSFGGRPKLSAHHAVVNLQNGIHSNKTSFILNLDLENFFGSVDQGWVMRFLQLRVKDPRIANLIQRWLRAGVIEDNSYHQAEFGVPQGGPISVLLSNMYLHYSLDLWLEKVVKPRLRGKMEFIRYLDDCVILFQQKADLQRVYNTLSMRLNKFSLRLNSDKTKVIQFGPRAGKSHGVLDYLGFTFYRTKDRAGRYKIGVKTQKKKLHRAMQRVKMLINKNRHKPIAQQHKEINWLLRGHYNYYGVGDNYSCLWALARVVFLHWRKQLSKRSQNGHYQWSRYLRLLKYFPLCKIKLAVPYRRYADFQIL